MGMRSAARTPTEAETSFVKDEMSGLTQNQYRFTTASLECLQEASEVFLTELFAKCQLLALHAKRKTIFLTDPALVQKLEARNPRPDA